jgi:hypothetical protein
MPFPCGCTLKRRCRVAATPRWKRSSADCELLLALPKRSPSVRPQQRGELEERTDVCGADSGYLSAVAAILASLRTTWIARRPRRSMGASKFRISN